MDIYDTDGKKSNVDIKDLMQEVHCGYPRAKRIMAETPMNTGK